MVNDYDVIFRILKCHTSYYNFTPSSPSHTVEKWSEETAPRLLADGQRRILSILKY